MMSQESQPSSSISARLIGRNGAVPKRWAQYLRYEKSGLKSGSDVSIGRDLYGRRAINSMPNSRICAGATLPRDDTVLVPVLSRHGQCRQVCHFMRVLPCLAILVLRNMRRGGWSMFLSLIAMPGGVRQLGARMAGDVAWQ